jgi:hypothetical protein
MSESRRHILTASLVLALLAAGCGADARHPAARAAPPVSKTATTTPTQAAAGQSGPSVTAASCHALPLNHPFVNAPADALVQLKQEPPGMVWQSIFVRPNGTGIVTTLVGEIVGAHQDPFRLSAAQFATLKRLIAATRTSARKSPAVNHTGYLFLLQLHGRSPSSFDGDTPTRYGALVRFLAGVMYVHC